MKKLNKTIIQNFYNSDDGKGVEDLFYFISKTLACLPKIYTKKYKTAESNSRFLNSGGKAFEKVLDELLFKLKDTRVFNKKFMGQIHPQGSKVAILAKFIGSFLNTNTVVKDVSPVESKMEAEVIRQIGLWFGYKSENVGGNIVSGGTTANLEALWIAREKAKLKNSNATYFVLATEMAHYSIAKSVDILGSNIKLVSLPIKDYSCDIEKSRELVKKISKRKKNVIMAVIGIAGETETGLIDDLNALSKIAKAQGAHFHVDAAYGGPFILSSIKEKFFGIEKADSIVIDPHKMLYVPYNAGMVLLKNKNDLALVDKVMKSKARYLLTNGKQLEIDLSNRNHGTSRIEGSLGSESVLAIWATLKLFGEKGISELLNYLLELTNFAYSRLVASDELRPLYKPDINTILIGIKEKGLLDDEYNKLIDEVQRIADLSGYYLSVNHCIEGEKSALRMVIMHPHTTQSDIEKCINFFEKAIQSYLKKRSL